MRRRSNWTDPRLDDLNGRVTLAHDRIDSMWRILLVGLGGVFASVVTLATAIIGLLANHSWADRTG